MEFYIKTLDLLIMALHFHKLTTNWEKLMIHDTICYSELNKVDKENIYNNKVGTEYSFSNFQELNIQNGL